MEIDNLVDTHVNLINDGSIALVRVFTIHVFSARVTMKYIMTVNLKFTFSLLTSILLL